MGVVLVVALLLGLTAALLLSPSPSSNNVALLPQTTAPNLPGWVVPFAALALIGVTFGAYLLRRLTGGTGSDGQMGAFLVTALLLTVGFAVLFHLIHPAVSDQSSNRTVGGTPPPPPNGTGTCPTPGTCSGPGLPGAPAAPWFEGIAIYGGIIALAVAAIFLVPWAFSIRARPADLGGASSPEEARADLQQALDRLSELRPGDDARVQIIRAYGELLGKVRDRLPSMETSTPREIAAQCALSLGIRPETAAELTGLFEEARYSRDRPLPAGAVGRAETALRNALAELQARRWGSP